MDVNWTYCGAHFVVYINIESLHYTPDINRMLCQLVLNKKYNIHVHPRNLINLSYRVEVSYGHICHISSGMLVPACAQAQTCASLPHFAFSEISLKSVMVEYLYHKDWQMLQTRICSLSSKPVIKHLPT